MFCHFYLKHCISSNTIRVDAISIDSVSYVNDCSSMVLHFFEVITCISVTTQKDKGKNKVTKKKDSYDHLNFEKDEIERVILNTVIKV